MIRNSAMPRLSHKYPDIEFHYIPPYTPHMGGAWESLVKLFKRALYALVPPGEFDPYQIQLVIKVAENLLNSRPLIRIGKDPSDYEALTPAHFMLEGIYRDMAPIPKDDHMKKRWFHVQDRLKDFRKRFQRELVPLYNKYRKEAHESRDPKVNDVVVLLEDIDQKQGLALARIVEVIPSKDGHVRRVKVRSPAFTHDMERSIKSLAFLFEDTELP